MISQSLSNSGVPLELSDKTGRHRSRGVSYSPKNVVYNARVILHDRLGAWNDRATGGDWSAPPPRAPARDVYRKHGGDLWWRGARLGDGRLLRPGPAASQSSAVAVGRGCPVGPDAPRRWRTCCGRTPSACRSARAARSLARRIRSPCVALGRVVRVGRPRSDPPRRRYGDWSARRVRPHARPDGPLAGRARAVFAGTVYDIAVPWTHCCTFQDRVGDAAGSRAPRRRRWPGWATWIDDESGENIRV